MLKRIATALLTITVLLECCSASAQSALRVKWMAAYVQGANEPYKRIDVRSDNRFNHLLAQGLSSRTSIWGTGRSLVSMVHLYLGVGTGDVNEQAGRYLSTSGCVPHNCTDADGLLWVDSAVPSPKLYFVATEDIGAVGQEKMQLWIFSPDKRSKPAHSPSREDPTRGLPQPFLDRLQVWFNESPVKRRVMAVTIVNPDGELVAIPACELHISTNCAD